jgi:hypothetical protein
MMALRLAGAIDPRFKRGYFVIQALYFRRPLRFDVASPCPIRKTVKLNIAPSSEVQIILLNYQRQKFASLLSDWSRSI